MRHHNGWLKTIAAAWVLGTVGLAGAADNDPFPSGAILCRNSLGIVQECLNVCLLSTPNGYLAVGGAGDVMCCVDYGRPVRGLRRRTDVYVNQVCEPMHVVGVAP